ncbi:hypothetical protein AKL58_23930, partial [Salmonella enterica]|nr:hypothetical protein [Salmonella enterica]
RSSFDGTRIKAVFSITQKSDGEYSFFYFQITFSNTNQKNQCSNKYIETKACLLVYGDQA